MNARLTDIPSLWDDIWPEPEPVDQTRFKAYRLLNLTSISVGNGWINSRIQYRSWVEFACGGAKVSGVPLLASERECEWAMERLEEGETMMDGCSSRAEW